MSISNSEIQIIYMAIFIFVIMFTFYGGYKYYKYRKNKPIPRGNEYYQKAFRDISKVASDFEKNEKVELFGDDGINYRKFINSMIQENGGKKITKEGYEKALKDTKKNLIDYKKWKTTGMLEGPA